MTSPQIAESAETVSESAIDSAKLATRYRDGYRLARAIVGLGDLCKVVGVVVPFLVVLLALMLGGGLSGLEGQFGGDLSRAKLLALVPLLLGCLAWWLFWWVVGVLVSAVGAILKAGLDGAVHTSPFLTNAQRAGIMSISSKAKQSEPAVATGANSLRPPSVPAGPPVAVQRGAQSCRECGAKIDPGSQFCESCGARL